jgi:hypothetical protein
MHERCCSHYDIDSKRILLFLLFLLFMPLSQIKPCIDVVIPKGIDYRIMQLGMQLLLQACSPTLYKATDNC